MMADLKNDSSNFERSGARGTPDLDGFGFNHAHLPNTLIGRYEESQVHESRQYYGSTDHQRGVAPVVPPSRESTATVQSYTSGTSASSHGSHGFQGQPQMPTGYGHTVTSSPTADPNYITTGYGNAGNVPYTNMRQDDRNTRYANEPQQHEATPRRYAEARPTHNPPPRYFGHSIPENLVFY